MRRVEQGFEDAHAGVIKGFRLGAKSSPEHPRALFLEAHPAVGRESLERIVKLELGEQRGLGPATLSRWLTSLSASKCPRSACASA